MALDTAAKRFRMMNSAGPATIPFVGPKPDGAADGIERSHHLHLAFSGAAGSPSITPADVSWNPGQTAISISLSSFTEAPTSVTIGGGIWPTVAVSIVGTPSTSEVVVNAHLDSAFADGGVAEGLPMGEDLTLTVTSGAESATATVQYVMPQTGGSSTWFFGLPAGPYNARSIWLTQTWLVDGSPITLAPGDKIRAHTPFGTPTIPDTGLVSGVDTVYGATFYAFDESQAKWSAPVTLTVDAQPDAFSFADVSGVERNTTITSEPITILGIDGAANASVSNGEMSVDGGPFGTDPVLVYNGQQIRARHLSSGSVLSNVTTTVTIGGESDGFTSTTDAGIEVVSVSLSFNGLFTILTLDEAAQLGAGGADDLVLTASGGAVGLTYQSGVGAGVLVYLNDRPLLASETITAAYTQPGDGILDGDSLPLPSFSGRPVLNTSLNTGANPTLVAARILESGNIQLEYSAPIVGGDDLFNGHAFTFSGGALTGSYVSGSGGTLLEYAPSRTIGDAETATVAFTQPGDSLQNAVLGHVLDYTATAFKEPRGFSLGGVTNIEPSAGAQTSQTVTMRNIDGTAAVSVTGDTGAAFSKNGGPFGTTPDTLANGDTLAVRVDGAGVYNTYTNALVTVGDLTVAWYAKTKRDPALLARVKPITRLHRRR